MTFPRVLPLLFSLCLFTTGAAAQDAGVAVPNDVLLKPTYLSANYSLTSGAAFVLASQSGNLYLVTCHSVFSKNSGLDRQWTPDQISSVVVAAVGVSTSNPTHVVFAQPYVPVPDARPTDDNGSERDIALFRVIRTPNQPSLNVETKPISMSDRVYILTKPEDSMTPVLIPARIAWFSSNEIRYLFDDPNVQLVDCFGCPVLSEDGNVVAMHLGQFVSKTGRAYGFSTPASAIAEVIRAAEKIDFHGQRPAVNRPPAPSAHPAQTAPAAQPASPRASQATAQPAQNGSVPVNRQTQGANPWSALGVQSGSEAQTRTASPAAAQPATARVASPAQTSAAQTRTAAPQKKAQAPATQTAATRTAATPVKTTVPVQTTAQTRPVAAPAKPANTAATTRVPVAAPAAKPATQTPAKKPAAPAEAADGTKAFSSSPAAPSGEKDSNSLDEEAPVVNAP